MRQSLVIALGGNALIEDPHHVTVHDQYLAAGHAAANLMAPIRSGHALAVVHGNGPQVGFILRRAELARGTLHEVPLDSCVADTQGALGYNIQMALRNEMNREGIGREVVTVVTQVLVDPDDPAFTDPTKPIGGFMAEEEARRRSDEEGWKVVEDAGRGWRRVVPSPSPREILEKGVIRSLVESGTVTIAAGGGGIPVSRTESGEIAGVEAVIDKDTAAALLARDLGADRLVIATAVEKVCLGFGTPDERRIDSMTVAEARGYIKEGQFGKGSMLPKIEAMISFVTSTGKPGLICDLNHLATALEGEGGTVILP